MMRFFITCVVKLFYLTWRIDGIASSIVGVFMCEHVDFAMVGLYECITIQVTMFRPGNSWSSIPVTETFLPVLSRTQTSAPARPPLVPLST